jgi:hypothetical protein
MGNLQTGIMTLGSRPLLRTPAEANMFDPGGELDLSIMGLYQI